MADPRINQITLTVLELHLAVDAVDHVHPQREIQLSRADRPDAHLSVSWGPQSTDRAVIQEGRILRHDE